MIYGIGEELLRVSIKWYYTYGEKGWACRTFPWKETVAVPREKHYNGVITDHVTQMIIDGHKEILHDVLRQRELESDRQLFPATIPEFRMTRRLAGAYEMTEAEAHLTFDDSIGMTGDWKKAGPVFNIPFWCLYGKKVKNLVTSGRCISVKEDLWDITRVIPTCAMTGEAAGTAAALYTKNKPGAFCHLDVKALQNQLMKQGMVINRDYRNLQNTKA